MAWNGSNWGSRRKSTSYSSYSSKTTTSWGNWGWDSFRDKDDNSNLIIKQPEGYLTPTKSEISDKLSIGNRYTGFYAKSSNLKTEEVEFVKNFSHFFYHDMLGEKPEDTFIEKFQEENISSLSDEEQSKYNNYKKAFDKIVDIKVPFYTPLEKSIFYLEVLREMAKEQNKNMEEMLKDLGENMQKMEIDENTLNNKESNEILDRMLGEYDESQEASQEDFDTLMGDEEDGEDGDGEGKGNGGVGEEGEEEGEGEGNGSRGGQSKELNNNNNGGERAEKTKSNGGNKGGDSTPENIFRGVLDRFNGSSSSKNITKSELLKKMSKISEFGEQFAIDKEVLTVATNNSRQRRSIRMTSLDQVANVELLQRILPNFPLKLATQDLRVDSPIKTTENKQKIIVLIDRSGSMASGSKLKWIMAFLADRLKSVMEEEAELFISNFEYHTSDLHFYHAYDKASALKLMKEYSWYPSGGDTNIGDMVEYISEEINFKGKLHNLNVDLSKEKVEILVINDGQDSVKTNNFPWKTNALTLQDGINEQLKSLCLSTEGKYIFIDKNDKIHEFEN